MSSRRMPSTELPQELLSAVRIARSQDGMITARQALSAGLTREQIRYLVHTESWLRLRRGCYLLPGAASTGSGERSVGRTPPRNGATSGRGDGRGAASPGLGSPVRGSPVPASPASGLPVPQSSIRRSPVPWSPGSRPTGDVYLRARTRAALAGRRDAVACNLTAARLLGLDGLPRSRTGEPVHILLPARATRHQADGVLAHFGDLPAGDVLYLGGIPVTGVGRTLADLVLRADRNAAIAILDAALHVGAVLDLDDVRRATAGRPGTRRVDQYWRLVDGRAESPLETRLRLILVDAGLAPPHLQWPVLDGAGRPLAFLDLAWPDQLLDVEADGVAVHDQPVALHRDRHRQNLLVDLGWNILRFTWADVEQRAGQVVAAIARRLRDRSRS